MEPSFSSKPLDTDETSFFRLGWPIPRKILNLWIVIRMVAMVRALAGMIGSCKGNFPRNMQERRSISQNHYYLGLFEEETDA